MTHVEEKGNIVKGCLATLTEFCDLHQESLEHSNHLFQSDPFAHPVPLPLLEI